MVVRRAAGQWCPSGRLAALTGLGRQIVMRRAAGQWCSLGYRKLTASSMEWRPRLAAGTLELRRLVSRV